MITLLILFNLAWSNSYQVDCSIKLPFVKKSTVKGTIHQDNEFDWSADLFISVKESGIASAQKIGKRKLKGNLNNDFGVETFNFYVRNGEERIIVLLRESDKYFSSVIYNNNHYPTDCHFKSLDH